MTPPESLVFEYEELKMKLALLEENVRFFDMMQKKLYESLGMATKELDEGSSKSTQERKMKRNAVYRKYFDVCDAIITLCKP